MRFRRSAIFYALVIFQVLFLIGIAISYYAIDWYGKDIRLKTAPIDPRDLFYGDYVILNYEISNLPVSLWKESLPLRKGEAVYVVLKPQGEFYEAVAAYPYKPTVLSEEEVYLKGKLLYEPWDDTLRVYYGLERYYVQEGTGKALEAERDTMRVNVRVAPWGKAKITGLSFE